MVPRPWAGNSLAYRRIFFARHCDKLRPLRFHKHSTIAFVFIGGWILMGFGTNCAHCGNHHRSCGPLDFDRPHLYAAPITGAGGCSAFGSLALSDLCGRIRLRQLPCLCRVIAPGSSQGRLAGRKRFPSRVKLLLRILDRPRPWCYRGIPMESLPN